MAKFATAYIELKPDLSNFGTGLAKEIEARLGDADINESVDRSFRPKFSGVGKSLAEAIRNQTGPELEQAASRAVKALDNVPKRRVSEIDLDIRQAQAGAATIRAELADLSHQKATVEVKAETTNAKLRLDEIQVKLAHLRAEKAEVRVDIDRSKLDALSAVGSDVGQALHGIAISLGGLLGVGGAITGLGQAAAAAAPLVLALAVGVGVLIASFGAAVAGAGALAIALAGALGPAAIVAFVALAKIAEIIKAIHTDSTKGAASGNAIAAAQDQLANATAGLASAQQNLKDQTTAAYQAWQDSIEAVKDDLLSVQEAQLGIADANLSLREALLALKEFKAQAPGLQGIFKKFTDVNVDMSGLHKALELARKAGGNRLSQDDELKLERLILDVRKAKLGEKEATDRLHDSNVQLQRDRQTEVRFMQRGIAAYPGYTSAVQGLASAQRSLASAQRASATAATAQAGALAKLSPVQQQLAATFKLISTAFSKALAPAMTALFKGLNRGLRIFVGVLADPKIARALGQIGAAMGSVIVNIAKFFASKGARASFVVLALGAAKLIRVLGSKVFVSFLKILLAIAKAAMPQLIGLAKNLADVLDRWAKWIDKHPAEFRKRIQDLVGTFEQWLGVAIDIGGFLIRLGGTLKSLGDTVGRTFRSIKRDVQEAAAVVHTEYDGLVVLGRTIGSIVAGIPDAILAALRAVGRAAQESSRATISALNGTLKFLLSLLSPFGEIGKKLGHAFASAFRTAVNAVKSIVNSLKTVFIDAINFIIGLVNKLHFKVPGIVPFVGGHNVGVHIDPISTGQKKPNLNSGHLPTLTKSPSGIRAAASASDSAAPRQVIENVDVKISAPAAAVPDPRYAARQFSLALLQAGG